MQFFKEQEHARKETRKLIVLYVIAVIGILFSINTLILYLVSSFHFFHISLRLTNVEMFMLVTGISIGTMLFGYFYYTNLLSQGGISVARLIGADEINQSTHNLYYRRFLNVLAEVSLAANMPAPHAYVLTDSAINAFAAGLSSRDNVVVVTEGALQRLTRDELQGVIAHEVGHLINGDSRLNIRLIGLLGSFMSISLLGGWLADSAFNTTKVSRRNNVSGFMILLGIGLWILGYVGVIIGKMLKSAISIEREFYADARAVQYTRTPDGLGGALRKIAGYTSVISNPRKDIVSHMFLDGDETSFMDGWFRTHPPIQERIDAIYGKRMPPISANIISEDELLAEQGTASMIQSFTGKPVASRPLVQNIPDINLFPSNLKLNTLMMDTEWIMAIVLALISADNPNIKNYLEYSNNNILLSKINSIRPELCKMSLHEQLMLINSITPRLKDIDLKVKNQLLVSLHQIIHVDKKYDLREFLFFSLFSFRLSETKPVALNKQLDSSIVPLIAKFSSLSENNAEQNYIEALKLLNMEVSFKYSNTLDYSGLFEIIKKAQALQPLEKERLLQALKVSVSTIHGLNTEAAAMLNVLATVLDVPWAVFKAA